MTVSRNEVLISSPWSTAALLLSFESCCLGPAGASLSCGGL